MLKLCSNMLQNDVKSTTHFTNSDSGSVCANWVMSNWANFYLAVMTFILIKFCWIWNKSCVSRMKTTFVINCTMIATITDWVNTQLNLVAQLQQKWNLKGNYIIATVIMTCKYCKCYLIFRYWHFMYFALVLDGVHTQHTENMWHLSIKFQN